MGVHYSVGAVVTSLEEHHRGEEEAWLAEEDPRAHRNILSSGSDTVPSLGKYL